jgi:hypothetical protein
MRRFADKHTTARKASHVLSLKKTTLQETTLYIQWSVLHSICCLPSLDIWNLHISVVAVGAKHSSPNATKHVLPAISGWCHPSHPPAATTNPLAHLPLRS